MPWLIGWSGRVAKERLDKLLVARGLAPTRAKAQALIMAGEVRVNGETAGKAGMAIPTDSEIELIAAGFFSSRTNEAKSPHSGKMEFSTKPKPEEVINEAYHIGS
jgi:ribosomal protein S4